MDFIGIIHTLFAIIAIIVGLMIFLMRKGTRRHRTMGYVYIISMLGLNITALMIYKVLGFFGPFHVLALISLAALFAGWWPAYRKKPPEKWLRKHYEGICWSYIGLMAALVAEIAVRLPWVKGFGKAFAIVTFVSSFIIVFIGAYFMHRFREQTLAPFERRAASPSVDSSFDKGQVNQ